MDDNKVTLRETRRGPVKESRREKRYAAAKKRSRERVIRKMFAILKPTEPMTADELKTEAYLLYKNDYLTKDQARIMGCNIK